MWRDNAYVLDMLLAARKVQEFTAGLDWTDFQTDDVTQNAVMRQIQIIGEAARKVSPQYQEEHAEIMWQEIIGMRNRLVHEYFRILPQRVWDVVVNDIPRLIAQLEALVPADDESGPGA